MGWLARLVPVVVLAGGMAGAGQAQAALPGASRSPAAAGIISTVVGGVGGPGPATKVSVMARSVFYGQGKLYVAQFGNWGGAVREIAPKTDYLTTPAGTGVGLNGQVGPLVGGGGPATGADFNPWCVTKDHAGNLVIGASSQVLVVPHRSGTFYGQAMTGGKIYVIAGTGVRGYSGNGGPATAAKLGLASGVAVDHAGNVLIADISSNRVRVVAVSTGTFYGQRMTAGDIYTIAGGKRSGLGDGGPARKAELYAPAGVTVDGAGNVLLTGYGFPPDAPVGGNRVRVIAAQTGTFYGQAMTKGDIYTIAGDGVPGYAGDGSPATSAELNGPVEVNVDASGNVLIADAGNNRVRVVAASTGTFYRQPMTAGDIYTIAGNGQIGLSGAAGPATDAQLDAPYGVGADSAGDILVPDTYNNRVLVEAAASGMLFGRPVTAGHVYDEAGDGIAGFSGNGGPGYQAQINTPDGVTADAAGNLLISDVGNSQIRVVAASTGTFYGQPMTAGDIYSIASIAASAAVAVDAAGNLVIPTCGNRVEVLAASTGTFYGQPMTAGQLYNVAGTGAGGFSGDGGPATSAELHCPSGTAVDAAGNLVIADAYNNRIRVVAENTGTFYGQPMTTGDIYTVAGTGAEGYNGDGIPATSAELSEPLGVAVDGAGNLLIADLGNQRIRMIAARAGTFYGQPASAGDIYSIAGNDTRTSFYGDGGPAADAALCDPAGIAINPQGNLLIADLCNYRIREVTG